MKDVHVHVAVIGCGNFARRQHLPIIASSPYYRLIAACDIDLSIAKHCASEFQAESCTTKMSDVLENPNIHAVVIAVRDHLQAEITIAAMRAGKHVYVEKPCAESERDFLALIEERNRSGVQVAVGFNKRFAPAYAFAHSEIIARGGARMIYLRMADDAWRWAKGYAPGSLLRHDVCHLLDLAPWLLGSPVQQVFAVCAREDDDAIIMKHFSGAASMIMNSGHATLDYPKERMEAICERGSVTVDDFVEVRSFGKEAKTLHVSGLAQSENDKPWVERLGKKGHAGMLELRDEIHRRWMDSGAESPECLPNFIRDQGWKNSLEAFAMALIEKKSVPHASIEDALYSSRLVNAVIESSKCSLPVQITELKNVEK